MHENPYIQQIIDAIDRLIDKYGQPIIDGPEVDWGQVLCRMRFGPHWSSHSGLRDGPTNQDIINCSRLERGEWPVWIVGNLSKGVIQGGDAK